MYTELQAELLKQTSVYIAIIISCDAVPCIQRAAAAVCVSHGSVTYTRWRFPRLKLKVGPPLLHSEMHENECQIKAESVVH